jgi:rhodanese-related sulfurtransferase
MAIVELAADEGPNPSGVHRLCREEQAELVEVLPADEYADEHLPGAINVPLKTLDRDSTASRKRQQPVLVYCDDYQ